MRADKKFIKVTYEQDTKTETNAQQLLNGAFDFLFDEVIHLMEKEDVISTKSSNALPYIATTN